MTSALSDAHLAGRAAPGGVSVYEVVGECTRDPDRWMAATDELGVETAKAVCRGCARRVLCARDAVETSGAEGVWAGIVIPEEGRGRTFALKQLRSLAERGGYPVRRQSRRRRTENE